MNVSSFFFITFYQRLFCAFFSEFQNGNELFIMTFIFAVHPGCDDFSFFFRMKVCVNHYSHEPASVYSIRMLMS